LDLAILICRAKQYISRRYHTQDSDYPAFPTIDRVGLQGGALNVAVCRDNPHIDEDTTLFEDCLRQDDEIISERLRVLTALLKKLEF
jgi:hypothetical protein